jgi:hypothetical protein
MENKAMLPEVAGDPLEFYSLAELAQRLGLEAERRMKLFGGRHH